MLSMLTRSAALGVALAACSSSPCQGPGLPNPTFSAAEVFTVVSTVGAGSHGRALMIDGYLALPRTGVGVSLYDVSDPYSPSLFSSLSGMGLAEPHTYAQTTRFGGRHVLFVRGSGLGGTGFGIYDFTDSSAPVQRATFTVPGIQGGYATGMFWFFVQGEVVYCPAGSLGLYIVDITDPSAPFVKNHVPKSALGGFNTVLAWAVGNRLVLANSDGGSGYALCDIGHPGHPVVIHSSPTTPIPYSATVNGGQLVVSAVSNCISCPGGNAGSFSMHDIATPGFPATASVGLPSRGASAAVQDQFVHVAASTTYLKLSQQQPTPAVIGQTVNPTSGGDIDWVTPIGNMVALGDDQGGATKLVPHQAGPDVTGPSVTMVVPADGAVDQPTTTRVGVTTSDMVDVDSLDVSTFFVRPLGGAPIAGSFSCQMGIVNFAPERALQANTTYEVVIPAGGMRDWSGNATPVTFSSLFSTGAAIHAVSVSAQPTSPVVVGQVASFGVAASQGQGPLSYSWDFGDGTPPTAFSTSPSAQHVYSAPGHYAAQVTVSSGAATSASSTLQTVHRPLTAAAPTRSSTIQRTTAGLVVCVNADNDSITAIDAVGLQKVFEAASGARPRTLAEAPDGSLWVACEGDATVRVHDGLTGALLATLPMPIGSAPYGVVFRPDGAAGYVSLRARGEVVEVDPAARSVVAQLPVGSEPKGLAVTADSQQVLVTRFLSGATGEVRRLTTSPFALAGAVTLAVDAGPDTENSGRGVPNYLSSVTISPDGLHAWVPSKKDNVQRGVYRDGLPLTFESTVRTILSQLDLATGQEVLGGRVDFNDRDMAFATASSPLGDYLFTALQGSNAIDVRDAYTGDLVAGVEGAGRAPQGLVVSPDGSRLFVHGFLSRSIRVYDVAGVTGSTTFAFQLLADVATVQSERLAAQVLLGKQVFYDATDPRMNEDGYISCASCHLDGGHDGRTWDFTDRGEGLRNTTTLIGRRGLGHGNVHWTGNFDEIQDFEHDIRAGFGGDGFLTQAQWQSGTVSDPLGQPKAGLSVELDALAAYVRSLADFGVSPHRAPDGSLPPSATRGKALFDAIGCASCHSGPAFTDSAFGVLHDVGTLRPSSGMASGGALTGLDTPSLRGLWATAPYLHDGAAATLGDVIGALNPAGLHGPTPSLTPSERQDLVSYLLCIDDLEGGCRLPGTGEDLELRTGVGTAPSLACLAEAAGGQVVRHVLATATGAFLGDMAALLLQVYDPTAPPTPALAGFQLGQVDAAVYVSALQVSGLTVDLAVPFGVGGGVLRAQGAVLAPSAQNGVYATTQAHDVFLR